MCSGYDYINARRAPVVGADFYRRWCRPFFEFGQDRIKIPRRISAEFRQNPLPKFADPLRLLTHLSEVAKMLRRTTEFEEKIDLGLTHIRARNGTGFLRVLQRRMTATALPSRPGELKRLSFATPGRGLRTVFGTMLFLALLVFGGGCEPVSRAGAQTSPSVVPLSVTEIAHGVFVHQGAYAVFAPSNQGDIANLSFVIGRDAVAVIDTGGSAAVGQALRAAIRTVTDKPIRYVINTHMHPDHLFGNAAFVDDQPEFISHHKLSRALAARAERYLAINAQLLGAEAFAGTRLVAPTRTVQDRLVIDLGERELILEAQPTAHTDNDLTIYDTATGTLFLGDLLFMQHIPALDGSIRGWLALIDRLEQIPAKRVVPGHGPPAAAWPEAMQPQKQYLQRISAEVRRMIKEGRSIAEAATTVGLSEKEAWLLFDAFNARNVTAAFAELEWE